MTDQRCIPKNLIHGLETQIGCLLVFAAVFWGYIFDSGLVYGGYACTFPLSIALLIPLSVGIYFAAK